MKSRVSLWLGATSAADYMAQLLLPALLVRVLSPADFGGYRILWMAAQTAVLALALNMAFNLIYLSPQQPAHRRGAMLGNVLAYLFCAGLIAAIACVPLLRAVAGAQPAMPEWAVPLFTFAWMLSLPVESIGLAAGKAGTQAWLTLVQTSLRIGLLGGAAWFTRSISGVAIGMIALACLRLLLVFVVARRGKAFYPLRLDASLATSQIRYSLGFGLGASLFALRTQVDGWVAAGVFDPVAVATIAIASAIVPIIGVVRQAFTSASVSEVARLVAQGERDAAIQINQRANLSTTLFVFPLVGAFVAVAPDAISLVYTSAYLSAATPARFYALAYAVCVLEMSTIVQALGDSRFVMRSGAVLLAAGAATTWIGAHFFGVPGVALGSLAALWLGSAWNLRHVAARCGRSMASLQPWGAMSLVFFPAVAACASVAIGLDKFSAGTPFQRLLFGGIAFIALNTLFVAATPARAYYRQWLMRTPSPLRSAASHA